jgi:hypothetical protein
MRIALLVLCLLGGVAHAHPLDSGYLRIDADGSAFAITFDLDVTVAGEQLGVAPANIDPVLTTRAGELAGKLYRSTAPIAGDQPCTWGTAVATRKGQTVTIAETATCPAGDVRWDLTFVKKLSATFQILGKVRAHGTEQVITVDKANTAIAIAGSTELLGRELWNGLAHTGVLPRGWPNGLAAVFLVIVLVLAAPTTRTAMIATWMAIVGSVLGAFGAATFGGPPAVIGALGVSLAVAGLAAIAATGKRDGLVSPLASAAGVFYGLGSVVASPHFIGFAGGVALGLAAIGLVIGLPLALARTSIQKQVPAIAIAAALGAIALVIKSSLG